MKRTIAQTPAPKKDKSGNYIGDGSYHVDYYVEDMSDYPQVKVSVSKSDSTESVYVRYFNEENGESITARFSTHENNAVKFGTQLNGYLASKNQILYRLGLKQKRFIPNINKRIWIESQIISKVMSEKYDKADITWEELRELPNNTDISQYQNKVVFSKKDNHARLIIGDVVKKWEEEDKEFGSYEYFSNGGRTIAQTPAPKQDRVYGSNINKVNSSKDTNSAKSIKFDESTLDKIENKVAEHNKKHPNKKISLSSAKAVVRRGMGAYSSSHRPTIKGGKPNSRVAWGLARLNAFLYKIVNGESKSGKYSQDNDLIEEMGYKVSKYNEGGLIAPNGKPSNLTPKQYKLVRTKAFKDWFGDWENDPANASKVVDENGEPLVVYHGTNKKFNIFKKDPNNPYAEKQGYFFAFNKKYAESYNSKYIKECFINLRIKGTYDDDDNLIPSNADGVILDGLQVEVFDNKNIKLADGTNNTFDGNNPDIRFNGGGNVNDNMSNTEKKQELIKFTQNQIDYLSDQLDIMIDTYDDFYDEDGNLDEAELHGLEYPYTICEHKDDLENLQSKIQNAKGSFYTKQERDFLINRIDMTLDALYDDNEVAGGKRSLINALKKLEEQNIRFDGGGNVENNMENKRTLTKQEVESMQRVINDPLVSPKLKESFKKVLDSRKVPENADFSRFPEGKYIDTYDFSGYEYMKSRNEEMGVSFLLTGEYELVSKAIFERDYAMWLFYNYLGRINISFSNCQLWIKEAQASFINEMPIEVGLTHQPNAKDGRSYAMWYTCSEDKKITSELRLGVKLTFEYNGRWYCNEIGMVGNFDFKRGQGWGEFYKEKKTGLLLPEFTESSFHFNTLIHEFAHCLDFQSQLLANINKYKDKKLKENDKEIKLNTDEMTELEIQLYGSSLKQEPISVSNPITNHFDYFIDALIKVLRQCASGKIPLTQKFEQQALDVQTALQGTYGDLLLAQREQRRKDEIATKKMDEMRENTRFTWQGKIISEFMKYLEKNVVQKEMLESLSKKGVQRSFTLSEIIELDNLISQYAKTEFLVFASKNPSKSQTLYNDLKDLKVETNRIINNHYDNIRRDYEYGFLPNTDLDKYLSNNCNVTDFRDYKSWKECNQSKLSEKMR